MLDNQKIYFETNLSKKFSIFYLIILILLLTCVFVSPYFNTAIFTFLLLIFLLAFNIYFAVKYKVSVFPRGNRAELIGAGIFARFWLIKYLPKNIKDLKNVKYIFNLIWFLVWNIFVALVYLWLWSNIYT